MILLYYPVQEDKAARRYVQVLAVGWYNFEIEIRLDEG